MEDLKDVGGYPGNTSEWYTVFLDEYTYDGENWQDYVNQDDRTVLFLIQDYVTEPSTPGRRSPSCCASTTMSSTPRIVTV